jgi:hypothetical protein
VVYSTLLSPDATADVRRHFNDLGEATQSRVMEARPCRARVARSRRDDTIGALVLGAAIVAITLTKIRAAAATWPGEQTIAALSDFCA